MKREDALYYLILLVTGFEDEYDQWLDGFLEREDPLSDIVLELSFCRSDLNKTISILHNYISDAKINEDEVCTKLRLFLKEAFYSGKFNKAETVDLMHEFVIKRHGWYGFDDYCWINMYYFTNDYDLAQDGIIAWDNFDKAFFSYLNDGIMVDEDLLWNKKKKEKVSIIKRIKKWFMEDK